MDKLQQIKNGWESASYITKEETEWLIEQVEYLQNRKDEVLMESGKRWTKLIKIKQILEEK